MRILLFIDSLIILILPIIALGCSNNEKPTIGKNIYPIEEAKKIFLNIVRKSKAFMKLKESRIPDDELIRMRTIYVGKTREEIINLVLTG